MLKAAFRPGDLHSAGTGVTELRGKDVCGNPWVGNSTAYTTGIVGAFNVSLLNASVSGKATAYFTDSTRYALMTGSRVRLAMVSLAHNDGGTWADADTYRTTIKGLSDALVASFPDAAVVLVGQNPRISPVAADSTAAQEDKVREVANVAAADGLGFIDAFAAFMAVADLTTVVSTVDGIHPTAAGSALWAATTLAFLDQA